jgi:L,D-transpeptidase catalytic domain
MALTKLSGSVGQGSKNAKKDSLAVQIRLNRYIEAGRLPSVAKLELNGRGGEPPTVQAIREFQSRVMAVPETGRITGTYDDTYISLCQPLKEAYVFDVVTDMISKCLDLAPLGDFDEDIWQTALLSLCSHMEHPRLTRYSMLTLVDFRRPRNRRRLWVIDLHTEQVRLHTFVAHGKGSGDELPNRFGVDYGSLVGGFVTTYRDQVLAGQTKENKEKKVKGPGVRLQGLDQSNRDTAQRGVIFHGAHYVNSRKPDVKNSKGCFATSWEDNANIVHLIPDGSFVYAYAGTAHPTTV